MNDINQLRVAWLVPSVELGAYWQPVLEEFTKVFPNTIFYTGLVWPGFNPELPGANVIKLVGEMKSLELTKTDGYSRRLMVVSPGIVSYLLQFKPDVIFAQAYSLWTLLALLLKPWGKWKFIIIYDGSSPNSDFRDSKLRSFFRRAMSRYADAFVANSYGAKDYLIDGVGAKPENVFTRTYLVPDAATLQQSLENDEIAKLQLKHPVFLYVGRITPRKGLKSLLEACSLLQTQGYEDYSLVVIGTGEQREELEAFIKERHLEARVTWVGWVEYGYLGAYFQQADVFVFPTFEDIWGMVALEAMVFGKPVLCSKGAGAAEMIVEGENGYIFDPYDPEGLAIAMRRFLDHPELINSMGKQSQQLISQKNPSSAAQSFVEVISYVVGK
ncbi:MAG: glycosyltransferase family 4 protein [Symplocastrum torsivum CPER-KK1]|jgi:glycosyltransferase involved in cell wall biosynthesis|uniref:Glycosyltransferase family 4 protein n=1 Tax=Symplocastrum torsivum CPER-KK1 TaxID=450513 RepID=A0A951PS88_9CYAN|nr:glycosyltransferase family 4 protein [Symplocastrum torsivum CPER-KK1]